MNKSNFFILTTLLLLIGLPFNVLLYKVHGSPLKFEEEQSEQIESTQPQIEEISKLENLINTNATAEKIDSTFKKLWIKYNLQNDSIGLFTKAKLSELQGGYSYKGGQEEVAIKHYQNANYFYNKAGLHPEQFEILKKLGSIFLVNDNLEVSKKYYKEAFDLHQKNINDSLGYFEISFELALLFQKNEEYGKSINLIRKLINWPERFLTIENKNYLLLKLSENYLGLNKMDEAESILLEITYNLEKESKLDHLKLGAYLLLADLYKKNGNLKNAIDAYKIALSLLGNKNQLKQTEEILFNLSKVNFELERYNSALSYASRGLEISKSISDPFKTIEFLKLLSEIYNKKQSYKKSLSYFQTYIQKRDSLHSLSGTNKFQELTKKIESQKRQDEIELLKAENELKESKIQKTKNLQWTLGIIAILSVVSLFLVIYNYKSQQKTRNLIHSKNLQLASAANLVKGQEEERTRIAQELHDGIGNLLTLLTNKISSRPEKDAELQKMIQDIAEELHNVSHNLMPVILLKFGLRDALEDLIEKWKNTTKTTIDLNIGRLHVKRDSPTALIIFRITQELLNNAIKKGQASYILIELFESSDLITLNFEDNGIGFNPKIASEGLGLKNIENRVKFLKGDLLLDSGKFGSSFKIMIPKKLRT